MPKPGLRRPLRHRRKTVRLVSLSQVLDRLAGRLTRIHAELYRIKTSLKLIGEILHRSRRI